QAHDAEKDPEAGRQYRRDNQQQVENRNRGPDFNETLEQKIDPAAEIALNRTSRHADDGREEGEDEAEQHRNAETVERARKDVAGLIVGAEQVEITETAIGIAHPLWIALAALFGRIKPERLRRGRFWYLAVHGVVGITDRRPDGPAIIVDLVLYHRVTIVGDGIKAAEFFFRIVDDNRHQQLALVGNENRPVIDDEFGPKGCDKQEEETPQRRVAAVVGLEILPAALVER